MCCAIACVIKCILNVVMSILMTIGFILTILGALLLWGFDVVMKGITPLQGQISDFLTKFGINKNPSEVMNMMATSASLFGAIAFGLGITLIIFSIAMIIIMCFCSMRLILIGITILMIILTIGLIIFVSYYGADSTNRILNPFEKFLQKRIVDKYQSMKAVNAESIIMNVVHIAMQCCGLVNYTDFNTAVNFNRTYNSNTQLAFPISCCNFKRNFIIDKNDFANCLNNQISDHKNKGCWAGIKPQINSFLTKCFATMGITIAILIGVIAALMVLIFCLDKVP